MKRTPQITTGSRRTRQVLLAAIALAVSLAVAEWLCRVILPRGTSMRFEQDVKELQAIQLPQLVSVIRDDPDLFWRLIPNQTLPPECYPFFGVISNGQGLREDHEIAIPKPPHEFRILFLGDSCTFGYGLEHTDGFVDRLEKKLQSEAPCGWTVECINAGVPGYSLFQGLRFLETEGLRYQPDLVVVTFGWNDMAMWDNMSDEQHWRLMQALLPPAGLRRSALCRSLWRLAMSRAPASGAAAAPRPRILPDEFHSLLDRTLAAASLGNTELLMLSWPMRALVEPGRDPTIRTPLQMEMHTFSAQRQVSLIDLVAVFQHAATTQSLSDLYLDIGHATSGANAMIADVLTRELLPWFRQQTGAARP